MRIDALSMAGRVVSRKCSVQSPPPSPAQSHRMSVEHKAQPTVYVHRSTYIQNNLDYAYTNALWNQCLACWARPQHTQALVLS